MDPNQPQADEPALADETQCDTKKVAALRRRSLAPEQELRSAASADRRPEADGQAVAKKLELQEQAKEEKEKKEDEDNNVVVPAWPSRSDTATLCGLRASSTEAVQHQVYSLKDYSQVQPAGTCKQPQHQAGHQHAHHQTSGGVGKLLKSMSQDQKFGPSSKRMSESIASPSSQHAIAAELRIGDRVRKLFISPLSLRSANTNQPAPPAGTHSSKAQIALASSHQGRLSIQSSATNVLNKPHHLMHAMYQRGQVGTSGFRRSPMSKKQAKSFRVYGCPLQMANNIYPITCFGRMDIYKQQSVPYVLARLCNYIEENSSQLTHEGIFRVSGNARLIDKLRTLFDHLGDAPLESESVDVATSASLLKMYLRELPEPLIPTRMNYYFITLAKKYSPILPSGGALISRSINCTTQSTNQESNDSTANSTTLNRSQDYGTNSSQHSITERHKQAFSRDLIKLIEMLPIEHYNLLKYLACFLHRITLKQQYNKMCAEALGIVFGPNVFRIRSESYKGVKEQEFGNKIMASIISNYRTIFDSELTDPLGNLVELDANDRTLMQQPCTSKTATQAQLPVSGPGSSESRSSLHCRSGSSADRKIEQTSSSPISAGSRRSRSKLKGDICCPKHCKARRCVDPDKLVIVQNQDDVDLSSEDVHGTKREDDGDDDHDDREDDSYTHSSSSESYCSSTDVSTDSLESPYDTEADNLKIDRPRRRTHNPDDGDDEISDTDIGSNFSSSECATETSYTPSSSRSDVSNSSIEEASSEPYSPVVPENNEFSKVAEDLIQPTPESSKAECQVCERRASTSDRVEPLQEYLLQVKEVAPSAKSSFRASRKRKFNFNSRMLTGGVHQPQDDEIGDPCKVAELLRPHRQKTPRQLHKYAAFMKRRSSSASSLNRIRHRRDQMMTTRRRQLDADGSSARRSHGSGRRSRTGPGRAKFRALARRSSGRTRPFVTEELGWIELATDRRLFLADIYRPDVLDCDRHFLLRPFNSDETLLASTPERAESGSGCHHQRHPDEQSSARRHMDQVRERMQNRRRFSGFDEFRRNSRQLEFVEILQRTNQEGIFEDVESVVQLELSSVDDNEQDAQKISDLQHPKSDSYVSLLDARIAGYKPSELSLDLASGTSKSSTLEIRTPNYQDEQDERDPLMKQMRATKMLIKSLRRTLKQGCRTGYSYQLKQILERLASSEASPPDYSDDCLASYADYMSAQNLSQHLDELLKTANLGPADPPHELEIDYIENLNGLLSIKITLFKQRYNDLKNIRDHFIRSHSSNSELELGRSEPSTVGSILEDRSQHIELTGCACSTRSHGSLDTLQSSNRDTSSRVSGLQTHRERKYSVPNRTNLENQPTSSSAQHNTTCGRKDGAVGYPINKSMSSISASTNRAPFTSPCKFGPLCPIEFVFNIERLLASKRKAAARLISLNEMTVDQLLGEKLELQKNLLRFEHWFGRPASRLEFSIVGHLYERYRAVKLIKLRKQLILRGTS